MVGGRVLAEGGGATAGDDGVQVVLVPEPRFLAEYRVASSCCDIIVRLTSSNITPNFGERLLDIVVGDPHLV